MAYDRWSIDVEEDSIDPRLGYLILNSRRNVTSYLHRQAAAVEARMKLTAPWQDRTGAARRGLYARVYDDGGEIVMEAGHSVSYGKWLELIQHGRFAVIMPTLEAVGPAVVRGALPGILGEELLGRVTGDL
jgi:hypothetical protein